MSDDRKQNDDRLADWLDRLLAQPKTDDADGYRIALVTYGSLLHPDEIDTLFHRDDRVVEPVKVHGYRRGFSKSVADHLRDVDDEQSGVLNLHHDSENWFNGLMIGPLSEQGLRKYAFREREYDLHSLSESAIDFDYEFRHDEAREIEFNEMFTCLLEEESREVGKYDPEPDYLELCLNGARRWSDRFYDDFLESTYVKDEPLKSYVKKQTKE